MIPDSFLSDPLTQPHVKLQPVLKVLCAFSHDLGGCSHRLALLHTASNESMYL